MSKSTPSLLALLGLVAVAGYQNRGKISEMLGDARQNHSSASGGPYSGRSGIGQSDADRAGAGGGLLASLGDMFGSGAAGGTISGGLGALVERFKAAGQGATADSWVANGPNQPLRETDLEQALGDHTLSELTQKTGLARADLLQRLSKALPAAVNQFTPQGRVPSETEAQSFS